MRNLRGQGSASRAGSQSSRRSRLEEASKISDSETDDIMEIEREHAIAYSYDDATEPSVVIHRQLESPDTTPRAPQTSRPRTRTRVHPYSRPASRQIEEATTLPPVTPTSDPEHQALIDEIIRQGVIEVKRQQSDLTETIEEVKKQKDELIAT